MNRYHTSKLPGRTVETSNGRQYLWFSGTDYLGMGHNEDLRRYVQMATETLGNHYGSSRNNSLRLDIYDETEQQLADFLNTESALIVSSGMWAGQLLMKEMEHIAETYSQSRRVVYHYAPGVHPALWGNAFERNQEEWRYWASRTVQKINAAAPDIAHIVCSDAVGSPVVNAFDFPVFNGIQNHANCWLVIDESHSLGVLGNTGKGISGLLDEHIRNRTIFVSSLNKAMGIPAGAIYANNIALQFIQKSPWYAGASPPAPAYMYALQKLLKEHHYEGAHAALRANVDYFNRRLQDGHASQPLFQSIPGYPVYCSGNPALFDHLLENGIMASCFPYPSASDAPVTRVALSTLHQKEDLDRLAEVCKLFIS